ncbi:DUF2314 domain-containing protein [Georgenia satyanarayanai]|uniref:DUF2314 domain-containing protein n=1 Tax=Georgenia satyanarayanai TaxID=860221 RepID=UPI00203CC5FD|nr:DUF2314 domain-containing protein [Georgenia satyanarayanai]MCM3662493.1 DUF2314 domain-containing protein [Georgenia satyanarayanai]
MIGELMRAPGTFGVFMLAVLIFGFAPGIVLAVIVRLIPDFDRRLELQAELYEVPRWERPFWVAQQFEVALRIGLAPRIEWMWGRYVWHRCSLESGLERHLAYPVSFEIPDDEDKAVIGPGDQVKLMWSVKRFPGERMWVTVTERKGDRLVGVLDNSPVFVYMDPGETVSFHIDDIIDCILEDEGILIEEEAA